MRYSNALSEHYMNNPLVIKPNNVDTTQVVPLLFVLKKRGYHGIVGQRSVPHMLLLP